MPDFRTFESEVRRREILAALASDPDYTINEALLRRVLREQGIGTSADQLRADLAWLQEQGLIRLRELGEVQIATALERGVDIATGAAQVPGVARPEPGR